MSRKLDFCFATLVLLFGFKSVVLCAAEEDVSEILTKNLLARLEGGTTRHYCPATASSDKSKTTGKVLASNGKHQGGKGAGEQPNIEDCAGESWALHGVEATGFSKENDAVTQWFVSKFLGSQVVKIEPNPQLRKEGEKQTFQIENIRRAFIKIASNPVGRMLLYRILIEINRVNENGNHLQEFDYKYGDKDRIKLQATNRVGKGDFKSCTIEMQKRWGCICENGFCLIKVNMSVLSDVNPGFYLIPVIDLTKSTVKKEEVRTDKIDKIRSIFLFHEMVHWFHWLRCEARYSADSNTNGVLQMLTQHKELQCYWALLKCNEEILKDEGSLFWKSDGSGDQPDFEEIRTILGTPLKDRLRNRTSAQYGDELSENAYRLSIHEPLRYGHESVDSLQQRAFSIPLRVDLQQLICSADIIHLLH